MWIATRLRVLRKVETHSLKILPAVMPIRVISSSVMNHFSTAREAKEFLVSEIVAEAQRENVPLSEIERKMLYFSETGWTLPDIMEVSDAFDREYDQNEYEKKIARLIRNATKRKRKECPEDFASWVSAARKLKKEDHYISVIVDDAGVSTGPVSDNWKGAAILIIAVGVFAAMKPILLRVGVAVPRSGRVFDSYTVDERLSNFLGYAWLCITGLIVCGLAFSHFDQKRRMYKLFDRLLTAVFRLFGPRREV
jgi:hypothetical protein